MSRFATIIRVAALATLALGGAATFSAPAIAKTTMVGGAEMYPDKNIVENAVNSKDHTTLVAAVKAAGLVDTLSGKGPFTVFAPTNEAFAALPKGTVETLLEPANKDKLTAVLTYHVVPGKVSAADIVAAAKKMNGMAEYKTVEGQSIQFKVEGDKVWLMGEKGGKGEVTIADVNQSNGVIHVIDTVLIP